MNMKLDNHSSIFLDTNSGDCGSRYVDGYSFIHPDISIQIGITMIKKNSQLMKDSPIGCYGEKYEN